MAVLGGSRPRAGWSATRDSTAVGVTGPDPTPASWGGGGKITPGRLSPEPCDSPRPHLAWSLGQCSPLTSCLERLPHVGSGGFRAADRALGARHTGCCAQMAVLCQHSAPLRPDSLRGRTLLSGPWAGGVEARQWEWGMVHSRDPLNPGQALGCSLRAEIGGSVSEQSSEGTSLPSRRPPESWVLPGPLSPSALVRG